MDTDSILGGLTAGLLAACAAGVLINAWCAMRRRNAMKESRSDPDLESLQNIAADSLPTHK